MRPLLVLCGALLALGGVVAGCGGSSSSPSSSQTQRTATASYEVEHSTTLRNGNNAQITGGTPGNNNNVRITGGTAAGEENTGAIRRRVMMAYMSTTKPGRQFWFTPNFALERIQCTTPACYQPGSSQRAVAGKAGSQPLTFDWPCEYFQPNSPPNCQSPQDRVNQQKRPGRLIPRGDRVDVLCQATGEPVRNELGWSSTLYNLGVVPPQYLDPEFRATAMKAPDGHDYVAWFSDIFDGNVNHHLPCTGTLARYAQANSLLK